MKRATSPTQEPDTHPDRWRMLVLLAVAELLGMSLWFSGSAVAPILQERWHLTGEQVGWLTTMVQLGFVAGTAVSAMLNLADIVPAKRLFAASAILGALGNAWLAVASGFGPTLVSRFAAGFFLAGVYPPAMKMAATWFRARRGLAVGTVVGALTVGKAGPYLVHAFPGAGVAPVVLIASASATVAALLIVLGYREGPYPFAPRPFSWGLVASVVRNREWRLASGGYFGHMAELYSYWTWIPAFVAASLTAETGNAVAATSPQAALLAFGVIAVGGVGCIWGGMASDRIGRERLVTWAMAASGTCALLIGLTFGRSLWLLVPVALAWGFFVIADSAQFSVLVTESVPAHAVGTALTVQTSLGFLLTTFTIQAVPPVVRAVGWSLAFPMLAVGPVLGIWSIQRLATIRRAIALTLSTSSNPQTNSQRPGRIDKAEAFVEGLLQHRGFASIIHEPDGKVPPDFLVNHTIAIEVRRLNQYDTSVVRPQGLSQAAIPLEKALAKLFDQFGPSNKGWSCLVSIRFQRPLEPLKTLIPRVRAELMAFEGGAQDKQVNRDFGAGLSLTLSPVRASLPRLFTLFVFTDWDSGGIIVDELERNVLIAITEKTQKIKKYRARYQEWWLILTDHIGMAALSADERRDFLTRVSGSHDWQKVILVNPADMNDYEEF